MWKAEGNLRNISLIWTVMETHQEYFWKLQRFLDYILRNSFLQIQSLWSRFSFMAVPGYLT